MFTMVDGVMNMKSSDFMETALFPKLNNLKAAFPRGKAVFFQALVIRDSKSGS